MDFSLITNWLGREGGDVLSWWLLATLAGAAAWPLLYRMAGGLPDRGYTLARPAGLILTGFLFWYLGSLGMLRNTVGGMIFAWVVVLLVGLVIFFRWPDRPPVRDWLTENTPLIIVTEVLFLLMLVLWAAYRAHNPELGSTEKPMEMAFLNGIRRSATFPPNDPWLAGYSISYYYFGYVIAAMLADLSGVSSGVAFNLMIALLFALTGTAALGVVYNLVRSRWTIGRKMKGASRGAALGAGLLGVIMLVWMGNLGTALIEFPWQGYAPQIASATYFDFWDVEGRTSTEAVRQPNGLVLWQRPDDDKDKIPNWDDKKVPLDQWSFTWGLGWRYSRVVHDRDLNGDPVTQPITEFPNFSFALSDIHPHVLALPFAVLAIGLALALVLGGRDPLWFEYPLYAIMVGGMIFLNSWDAIYLPLLVGADVLRRLIRRGTGTLAWEDIWKSGRFALIVGALTLWFYLPWIVSFASQAKGILPNVIYPTAWQQFFLQFGIFLVILTIFVLVELRRGRRTFNIGAAALILASIVILLVVTLAVLGIRAWNDQALRGAIYAAVPSGKSLGDLVPDVLARRLTSLPQELLLVGMIVIIVGRLFGRRYHSEGAGLASRASSDGDLPSERAGQALPLRDPEQHGSYSPATGFVLLLVGLGALLTLIPDFMYLHDNFGVRINTVFKLYYQGWIVFSLASAFAVWSILAERVTVRERSEGDDSRRRSIRLVGQVAFVLVVIVFVGAGMTYPFLAAQGRALVDTGRISVQKQLDACDPGAGYDCPTQKPLTLDGAPTLVSVAPYEYAAIQCLDKLVHDDKAVIAEAPYPGGYAQTSGKTNGRVSALTGIPTLMGWQNHESQWRGDTYQDVTDYRIENGQVRDRIMDVQELFTTQDWTRAWAIIDRYKIDYIVVGSAERGMISDMAGENASQYNEYSRGLEKFSQVFRPVCQSGEMSIYRVAPN